MSVPPSNPPDRERSHEDDDDALRALLRPAEPGPDLLAGVQRRIRQRSRGRFYADAWSLGTSSPIAYLLSAAVLLLVLVLLYLLLAPGGLVASP
jgi:hypothetical protein